MNQKKKSKIGSIIGVIVVILFVGLVIYAFAKDEMASDYIEEVSYSELKDIIKKNSKSIILIGRNDCSHCLSYKPTVEDVAKTYKLTVYYINTNKISNQKDFDELWTFFNAEGTPTTAIVGNGEMIAREEGELTRSNLIAFLKANYF